MSDPGDDTGFIRIGLVGIASDDLGDDGFAHRAALRWGFFNFSVLNC
jgi:hypothetical protein